MIRGMRSKDVVIKVIVCCILILIHSLCFKPVGRVSINGKRISCGWFEGTSVTNPTITLKYIISETLYSPEEKHSGWPYVPNSGGRQSILCKITILFIFHSSGRNVKHNNIRNRHAEIISIK